MLIFVLRLPATFIGPNPLTDQVTWFPVSCVFHATRLRGLRPNRGVLLRFRITDQLRFRFRPSSDVSADAYSCSLLSYHSYASLLPLDNSHNFPGLSSLH